MRSQLVTTHSAQLNFYTMSLQSIAIFCRVVDNFGDIGVCWRMARQMQAEYGLAVQLWVDDLSSFQKICAPVVPHLARQSIVGVDVICWSDAGLALLEAGAIAASDAVIEGFGCNLPDRYFALMQAQAPAPVWLNLEYLSAESWVESCHGLPSHHPQTGMRKYFYFPGFTAQTGGLLAEGDLPARRGAFQAEHGQAQFWQRMQIEPDPAELKIGIFCYPHAPLRELLDILQNGAQPVLALIAHGVATEQVSQFLQKPVVPGASLSRGNLRLHVLPFVEQSAYDELLWAMDLNFVRGEDSFVRAQWAAKPMLWHIYPQEEGAHLEKLQAFLALYTAQLEPSASAAVHALAFGWNAAPDSQDLASSWQSYSSHLLALRKHSEQWMESLTKHGNLVAQMLQFIRQKQS